MYIYNNILLFSKIWRRKNL